MQLVVCRMRGKMLVNFYKSICAALRDTDTLKYILSSLRINKPLNCTVKCCLFTPSTIPASKVYLCSIYFPLTETDVEATNEVPLWVPLLTVPVTTNVQVPEVLTK